ncbi:hypothetical protein FB451DRAFT_1270090 [Mycena latifolia]|nr:hypothetical protein FB451DRAFT_1270090 [Mycena latifolia]
MVVFKEYTYLHDYVSQAMLKPQDMNMITISGSKGIGKTMSLYYLLIRRLQDGRPTIFSRRGLSFYFNQAGVLFSNKPTVDPSLITWRVTWEPEAPVNPSDRLMVLVDAANATPQCEWFQPMTNWKTVFASTASKTFSTEIGQSKYIMNPPAQLEMCGALLFHRGLAIEAEGRMAHFSALLSEVRIFGPCPGIVFPLVEPRKSATSTVSPRDELLHNIQNMINKYPWDNFASFMSNANPSVANLATLPTPMMTITRGTEVYKPRVRFASRRLEDMIWDVRDIRRNDFLLKQFWVLRDHSDSISWPYFERLAGQIITGRIGCRTRWAPMQVEIMECADKAFVQGEKTTFHARVLASETAPIQLERFDSETAARRPNSPMKRSRSSTSPSTSQASIKRIRTWCQS